MSVSKKEYNEIIKTVENLRKIVSATFNSVNKLKEKVSTLEEKVDSKDDKGMETDIERICNDIARIQEEKKDNLKELSDLNIKIRSLEQEQNELKNNLICMDTNCNKNKDERREIDNSQCNRNFLENVKLNHKCKQCPKILT